MTLIKKEPVILPKMCHYRLNPICENKKTSLSPRCISLLAKKSSDTNRNIRNANSAQSPMGHVLLTTTETHFKRYGLHWCRRLPDLSISHRHLLPSQETNARCIASYPYGKNWKLSGESNFGLKVISCQPIVKDQILEDKELSRPKRKQAQSLRQRVPLIKPKETEYLQVVSSLPRIKKIMSPCNISKTDRGKSLHDHMLCERFEMHMLNHLQRSKSEILQKSYSSHVMEQLYLNKRLASSASAIKSRSMQSPKFYRKLNSWKTSDSEMQNPPTSPEIFPRSQTEMDKLPPFTSDIGCISVQEKPGTSLVDSEAKHKTKPSVIVGEIDSSPAERDKTLDNFLEKNQKDGSNLLEKDEQRQKSKTLSGNEAQDYVSTLSDKQDLKLELCEEMASNQDTILDVEQKNTILASSSTFNDGQSFQQKADAGKNQKETSKDSSQRNEIQERSLPSSRKILKKERKSRNIFSSGATEDKLEDDAKTDFSDEKKNRERENPPADKEDDIQVKLGKPKLPSFQPKRQIFGKKSSKMKLTPLARRPNVRELLKPLPGHRHKQYFDPQEMAERRRQKLLEKMNHKRFFFDEASPTEQTLFQDYSWLAKYCIFNKDNWKIYGRTFEVADTKNKGWLSPKETMMALRLANSQLTPSEEEYLCRIIEMTGYSIEDGSDIRLFSILAALSHRITSLDNWMKSLLDNIDYRLLDMKTFKCKTLWECNVDPETNKISLEQLIVELRVGGVSLAHQQEAKDRLQHLKALDLLDFLTYIPLFIMIHESVVNNPLDFSRHK